MAFVLTTSSVIVCDKGGFPVTTGQDKLKIAGAPVLRADGVAGKKMEKCPAGDKACTSFTAVESGKAGKLKVSGESVLLDTLKGTVASGHAPTLIVAAQQSKLKAV